MRAPNRNPGFTLVELVVTIALLGVLAAFAVPRFADLRGEARSATLQSMMGSSRSASMLAHSVAVANDLPPNAAIVMEGQTVTMFNRYPDAPGMVISAQLASSDQFNVQVFSNTVVLVQATDVATWTQCGFAYVRAFPPGNPTPRYFGPFTGGC